ncbi:molybdopterin-binding protein [Streptomyces sp. NBC_01369]|uniref:molybdopterin-binding protein n=1 Tax=unclassified Streptomyces TaxID=2593676 RepID=UPI00224EC4E8|nr:MULTISPECIES: molybdopterin-binding protein [unclassified Streptomyces]MCX4865943.1 molybdopterin-binding protein [Streptomyces sp. NBC_00906]MCX4897182.1 molybdopterin-binding protein [Streptomyces sp. NBC_00892]
MTAGGGGADRPPAADTVSAGAGLSAGAESAPASGLSADAGPVADVGPEAGFGSSACERPRGGERCPTPEEVRAADEERAVEQALALVGSRPPGEHRPTGRPRPEGWPQTAGRPRPAETESSPPWQQSHSSETPCPEGEPAGEPAGEPTAKLNPNPMADPTADPTAVPRSSDPDRGSGTAPGQDRHGHGHRRRHGHGPASSWPEARALAARSGRSGRSGQSGSAARAIGIRAGRLPLGQALGHVLAEPLVALTDLPPFDTSAMDGWVVSGPGPWNVREVAGAEARAGAGSNRDLGILAGRSAPATLPDGDAVRIATGARIPADANAVIRSEHARVDRATGLLHAEHQVLPGQDIRPRGQECRAGDRLMPAGALVTPAVLGLAAAAGYDTLVVVPRPRVDVLVLGDELLTGGLPHDGLIRDALGPMIGPWLRALGAEVSAPQRLGDDAAALRHALTTSDADLVITTGGTAAGPVDHVHPVLAEIGAELLVDGVAVRPGHPMLLARLKKDEGGPYLVGLPGNPLAAVSGLLTLAEPLLRGLAGREPEAPYRVAVRDDVHGHPHDTRLVPVVHRAGSTADGRSISGYGSGGEGIGGAGTGSGAEYVVPLRYNGPAMLRGIAAADGLAVVPPGGVRSGTEVEILDLPWASAMPWTEGCFT